MANNKLKTHALKKILQSPGCQLVDEELFRLVKKQDRSAESLVLKKFVMAVSEIPLIEYNQSTKIFTFNRNAQKARSYFIFISYLFGVSITSKWPDFKKLATKIPGVNETHFINSYCQQTIIQEKLAAYNTQMTILFDFILKSGKGKEVIFDKLINETLVDYFPSLSLNWVWIFNAIVKEPKPKNLVSSTLTIDKAQSQLIKCAKKAAKDCEIEVQRLRVESTPTPYLNWADVVSPKVASAGVVNPDPVESEVIPLSVEQITRIKAMYGSHLKYIQEVTGSKITLGKMKNGLSGFLVEGTKRQNDAAVTQVLALVNGQESKARTTAGEAQESVAVVTYSTDILEKFVTNKEVLSALGSVSQQYPAVTVNVEPHKQRVVVKGKNSLNVKQVVEYLRESLGDFASDLVSRSSNSLPSSVKTADTPVTRPLSAGHTHNAWIAANQTPLLLIALRNHVSLRFPAPHRKSDILTLSGKLQNVEQTDREIRALLGANLNKESDKSSISTPEASQKPQKTPPKKTPPKNTPPKKTVQEAPITAKKLKSSTTKPNEKIPSKNMISPFGTMGVFVEKIADSKDAAKNHLTKIPATTYQDLELKDSLLAAIKWYGLEKPSPVHGLLIPHLLAGDKVVIQAELGTDVCSAMCISVMQLVNCNLKQTQGFILVRDKLLISPIVSILRGLANNLPVQYLGLYDSTTACAVVPHIICSTPTTLLEVLTDKEWSVKNLFFSARDSATVVIFTDLASTISSFGYQILQQNHFNELIDPKHTKLIFQSGKVLSTKVSNLLEKISDASLETVQFSEQEIEGTPKFVLDKKGTAQTEKVIDTSLNNLTGHQLDLAKRNLFLVYSVTEGYPDIEVDNAKEGDIILRGKTADVNTCKTKIQERIVLHDKEMLATTSPAPAKTSSSPEGVSPVRPLPASTRPPNSESPKETNPPTTTQSTKTNPPTKTQSKEIKPPTTTQSLQPSIASIAKTTIPGNSVTSITTDFPINNHQTTSIPATRRPNSLPSPVPDVSSATKQPNKTLGPVQLMTKLVSMTHTENRFIHRNRAIVEEFVKDFPTASIEFSIFENDNISVNGPVDHIGLIHANVLEKVRAAMKSRLTDSSGLPNTKDNPTISQGRLASELESFLLIQPSSSTRPPSTTRTPSSAHLPSSTEPVSPSIISFDTSIELESVSGYDPTKKRHQHTVRGPVLGPPPGYSGLVETESTASLVELPINRPPNSESAHSTRPSDTKNPNIAPKTRPPNSESPNNTIAQYTGLVPATRPPNSQSPSLSRPPNSDIPSIPSISRTANLETLTYIVPPISTSDVRQSASTALNYGSAAGNSVSYSRVPHSAAPPIAQRTPHSTDPPVPQSDPHSAVPPIPQSDPHLAGPSVPQSTPYSTDPPVPQSSPHLAGPSVPQSSLHSTDPPIPQSALHSAGPPVPQSTPYSTDPPGPQSDPHLAGPSVPQSSLHSAAPHVPQSALHSAGPPVPQTAPAHISPQTETVAPNGYPWKVLHKMPLQIPRFGQGTPEQWMYSKLREKLLSGLAVSSIPLLELVKIFVFEFPAAQSEMQNLISEFYKVLKTKHGIFTTKVTNLPDGKKSIDVSLNLPKKLSVGGKSATAPNASSNSPLNVPNASAPTPLPHQTPQTGTPSPTPTSVSESTLLHQSSSANTPAVGHVSNTPAVGHVSNTPAVGHVSPSPAYRVSAFSAAPTPDSSTTPPTVHSTGLSPDTPPSHTRNHPSSQTLPTAPGRFPAQEIRENATKTIGSSRSSLFHDGESLINEDMLFGPSSDIKEDSHNKSTTPIPEITPGPKSQLSDVAVPITQVSNDVPHDTTPASAAKSQKVTPGSCGQTSESTPDPSPQLLDGTPDPSTPSLDGTLVPSATPHSSPGSDYDFCGNSSSVSDVSCPTYDGLFVSSTFLPFLVDNPSNVAASSSDTKEDELDRTFTKLNINETVGKMENEPEELTDIEEERYTTFFCTEKRTSCSIGSFGDSSYLNINVTQPSWILVHGGDLVAKNSIMKQIVDVWVSLQLPVFVVSPKLETVSSHTDNVDFYQFKTLTASQDPVLVARCEDFLTRDTSLKLLVINTTHKAIDTDDFLSVLAEQYTGFNVVVVSIAVPHEIETITGLITTWRRIKRDKVLDDISTTFEMNFGLDQIKRGTLASVSLDGEETKTVLFSCLFGK